MANINSTSIKNKLVDLHRRYAATIESNMPMAMNSHREAAICLFDKQGLPTKGCERYKYTDVMQAFGRTYGYSFAPFPSPIDNATMFKCSVPNLDTYTLMVYNGWLDVKNSNFPTNIVVTDIASGAAKYPQLFEQHYNSLATTKNDSIIALNTAFARSGLFVYIPDNVVVDKPIQIINVLSGSNPLMVNQRNLIIAGANSQSKIVVCDHTLARQQFLLNNVTEVMIDKNAMLDCYNIQNINDLSSQINSMLFNLEANSQLLTNTLTLHGGFVRNNIEAIFSGEHAEANIYGLSLPNGNQHVDNYTYIDHAVPNCNSYELYKNILNDNATGAFNGYVLVRKDAQKTNALQSNKNICISATAKMFTKPQLEIYADDVKCSHGATVGQLDESALFYMQQRGIGKDEARMMLMSAFAHEVVRNIKVDVLAERYAEMIESRLRGKQPNCGDCFMKCHSKEA